MNKSTFYFLPTGQKIYFKKNGVALCSSIEKTKITVTKNENNHGYFFNITDNNETYLINEIFYEKEDCDNNISYNDLPLSLFEKVEIFNIKLYELVLFSSEDGKTLQGIIKEKKIIFQGSFLTIKYDIENIIPYFKNGEKIYDTYYNISESNIIYSDK